MGVTHALVQGYAGAKGWSSVSRSERYKRRCTGGDDSMETSSPDDNPMPAHMDPITLEPVVNPALGPSGHVMGMATWRAVLSETDCCPFTKQPLQVSVLEIYTNHKEKREQV